jgi:hypothetical protein
MIEVTLTCDECKEVLATRVIGNNTEEVTGIFFNFGNMADEHLQDNPFASHTALTLKMTPKIP